MNKCLSCFGYVALGWYEQPIDDQPQEMGVVLALPKMCTVDGAGSLQTLSVFSLPDRSVA